MIVVVLIQQRKKGRSVIDHQVRFRQLIDGAADDLGRRNALCWDISSTTLACRSDS